MSGLRFLLDENVPCSVMKLLESGENRVEYVPKGTKNSEVKGIFINYEKEVV